MGQNMTRLFLFIRPYQKSATERFRLNLKQLIIIYELEDEISLVIDGERSPFVSIQEEDNCYSQGATKRSPIYFLFEFLGQRMEQHGQRSGQGDITN